MQSVGFVLREGYTGFKLSANLLRDVFEPENGQRLTIRESERQENWQLALLENAYQN